MIFRNPTRKIWQKKQQQTIQIKKNALPEREIIVNENIED